MSWKISAYEVSVSVSIPVSLLDDLYSKHKDARVNEKVYMAKALRDHFKEVYNTTLPLKDSIGIVGNYFQNKV